jgi:hypothetical protein
MKATWNEFEVKLMAGQSEDLPESSNAPRNIGLDPQLSSKPYPSHGKSRLETAKPHKDPPYGSA